jgi:hypothetical protein
MLFQMRGTYSLCSSAPNFYILVALGQEGIRLTIAAVDVLLPRTLLAANNAECQTCSFNDRFLSAW